MHTAILHTETSGPTGFAMPAVAGTLALWLRRMSTRRALRELDRRQLADIGRTEAERRVECAKWFWQP